MKPSYKNFTKYVKKLNEQSRLGNEERFMTPKPKLTSNYCTGGIQHY